MKNENLEFLELYVIENCKIVPCERFSQDSTYLFIKYW